MDYSKLAELLFPGVTETETLISLEQSLNRQIRIDVDEE